MMANVVSYAEYRIKREARMSWKDDRASARKYDEYMEAGWRRMFPLATMMVPTKDGSDEQRHQIDRWIHMPDGRVIPVEEKVRFRSYDNDVLLELEHVFDGPDGRREPGWFLRRCDAEYYGFFWVDSKAFVVLPAMALRAWWDQQVATRKVSQIEIKSTAKNNNGYRTRFALVPLADLPFAQGVNLL